MVVVLVLCCDSVFLFLGELVCVIDLVVLCCCPLFMCSLVLLVVIALWYCGTSVRKYFMFSAIDYAGCS